MSWIALGKEKIHDQATKLHGNVDGQCSNRSWINSERIKTKKEKKERDTHTCIIGVQRNEHERIATSLRLVSVNGPSFYSSGKWTCTIVIYSSAWRYTSVHIVHITGKQLGYLALMRAQYTLPRKMAGLNGLTSIGQRTVQSFISI